MILNELEKIVREERGFSKAYICNLLKEYLQMYVLYFVYTTKKYNKNLIFTGGTCLRHFYGLERLSEDIDFYYIQSFKTEELRRDLENFFKKRYKYEAIQSSLKQKGKQILLKFPVLAHLGLSHKGESDFLYVKLDIEKNASRHYTLETSSKSKFGFNFVAKHYDLSSLMAGKIHAILLRRHLKGTRESLKGRDYFDLLWFVKNEVNPNMKRLSDLLGKKMGFKEMEKALDRKVKEATTTLKSDFRSDLLPLVMNADTVQYYVDNYFDEYRRYKKCYF